MKNIKMYNGIEIPQLGYGEYLVGKDDCINSTIFAIQNGYTHIDTAQSYANEEEIGIAIKKSGVDRNKLFLTTKIWLDNLGYEKTLESIQESLRKLQTDYLDLVLIHQPYGDYYGSWRALEELYNKGIVKSIGVSNFSSERLFDLIWHSKIKPMVNQIEINPLAQRKELIDFCHENNIVVEAWSPLGGQLRIDQVINNDKLIEIAKTKNKTVPQIILRWLIQQNIVVLVKSIKENRILENIDVFDFELTDKEMEEINSLDQKKLLFDHSTLEGISFLKKLLDKRMKNK